ncbi:MAG TPA: T9SS type A sorting domain-containing protein, partial [Chitinophagaceae bacterium]|nr:T9SS type A sorting domain-containing protein [Chitinophagaceae bacterium]
TTLNDNSGNGYNGTLLNFALTGISSNFVDDVVFFSPDVTISSSDADNTINAGDAVTFTAVANNAGSAPVYQWKKNGTNISGENAATYATTTLSDGDAISCEIDPSTTCYVGTVSSSAITTSVNGTLPLRLMSFSATAANCITTLRWITADEQLLAGFQVEQSADGSHFEKAATVAARNTNSQNSYAVELPVTSNVMFYRLKVLDKDGKISYSNVALISAACSHPVSVYPNPIIDKIFISGAIGSHYAIYDNKGSRLLEGMLSKTSEVLNAQRLKPGIYFIRINRQSFKLIKQ